MLTRIRIEVEAEDSAAAVVEALDRYEEALQQVEAQRLRLALANDSITLDWAKSPGERSGFFNQELGRTVTDEVIEKDKDGAGYKGRRVVQFDNGGVVGGLKRDGNHTECLGGGQFCATSAPAGATIST